jgi:FG-GAP-like repeat
VATLSSPYVVRIYRNAGSGQFPAPYTDIQLAPGHLPGDAALLDADADGDLDLCVVTSQSTLLLENDGTGSYSNHSSFPTLVGLRGAVGDANGDGHPDVAWRENSTGATRVRLNCATNGIPFCFGDSSGTPCPCGNASAFGAQAGCTHSFGGAGKLVSIGTPSVAADAMTLVGTGMTNGNALYFQAVSTLNGGAGSSFGDGLRCAGGTTIRLGTKSNASGASQYPNVGDASVSVQGAVAAGATRYYQILYRNNASFCTSATFNMSNGLRLTWSP